MSEKKQRDAAETRERILQAAAVKFSLKGYDATGTREIAEAAGANLALVNRYFGSKAGLFREAILADLTLAPFLEEGPAAAPGLMTQKLISKVHSPDEADPIRAILQSISADEVRSAICDMVCEHGVTPLSEQIEGADARTRAALAVALLFGVDAVFRVLTLGPCEAGDQAHAARLLEDLLRQLIAPEGPAPA